MKPKPFYLKHFIIILMCCLCSIGGWGQVNLVKNPSLELLDSPCLQHDMPITYIPYWSGIDSNNYGNNGECWYVNLCDLGPSQSMCPVNGRFTHFPRTGNGMCYNESIIPGFCLNYREYAHGHLFQNLIAGKQYCVAFYVSQTQQAYYSIGNIGAYLDDGSIDTAIITYYLPQTQYTPQIIEHQLITDTLNWVKVEGSFIANGTEKFITIGIFTNDNNTPKSIFNSNNYLPPGEGCFLLDDISVIESDTKAYVWNADTLHKGYLDSILIGRDETIPGIRWYRDGVLIDTLHAGIWIKDDTLGSYHTYILSQTLCGVTTYDTVLVSVELVSSGINTNALKNETLLYPNPISNELNIANAPSGTSIKVYDIVGRLVYNGSLNAKQESINTSAWERGAYFVELVDENGSRELRKVVK